MEYSKPDKKAITAWRISRIMGFVIALIVCTAIGMAGGHLWETEKWKQLLHLGLAIFLLYKLAGIFFYPIIEYKHGVTGSPKTRQKYGTASFLLQTVSCRLFGSSILH